MALPELPAVFLSAIKTCLLIKKGNQKMRIQVRAELALDLIDARIGMTAEQRSKARQVLREQFTIAIEAEREECARVCEEYAMSCDKETKRYSAEDERLIIRSGARASLRCAESIRNRNT
jgi:hypothetical protein